MSREPIGVIPSWVEDALCAQADPEAWFVEKGGNNRPGKDICGRCAVQQECLDYAVKHHIDYGVWGGLSERERRPLVRQAREAA